MLLDNPLLFAIVMYNLPRWLYEVGEFLLVTLPLTVGHFLLMLLLSYILAFVFVAVLAVVAAIVFTIGGIVYDLYRGVSAVVFFGGSIGHGICKGVLRREGREENNPLRC